MIKEIFIKILNNGINNETDTYLIKNIRVINVMASLVIFNQIITIPVTLIFYSYLWPVFFVCIMMIFLMILCLLLVRKNRFYFSIITGAYSAIINTLILTMVIGTETNIHFLLPITIIGAFYYFPYKYIKSLFVVIIISILSFIFLEIWFINHTPFIILPDFVVNIGKIYFDFYFSIITFGFMYYGYIIYRNSENNLKDERTNLKKRNDIMEHELEMAKNIQKQFIPSKSPSKDIAFLYKPMDKVGGDFLDFIIHKDNEIGIFISDVSGHGVPAAFITSMIKSIILQNVFKLTKPSELLKILNNNLINLSGGNFITAFYGIYNFETRNFLYSNAGHNPPLIVKNGNVEYLKFSKKNLPLAVMSSKDLIEINKDYFDEYIEVDRDSKIILYTDGLTETIPNDVYDLENINDYENIGLFDFCNKNSKLSPENFINELYNDLKKFRKCDNFDDDICVVCINT